MFSTAKESDPLLPSYEPAPEISSHHTHQSREIDYGTYLESTSTGAEAAPELWNKKHDFPHEGRWKKSTGLGGDEDEEEPSRTIENAMSRFFRGAFTLIFFGCFFAIVVSFLNSRSSDDPDWSPQRPRPNPRPERTIEERVNAILSSTPLIDGHNDLAIFIRGEYKNNITGDRFTKEFEIGGMPLNEDLPRLRSGQVGGAFWSAFVVCPVNASYDMTDSNYATEVAHTIEQIDLLRRLQAQYPSDFTSGLESKDMLQQWRASKGRSMFGPLSIEGLHQVPPTAPMSTLRHYYSLGVRMATLTWNCHNPFADATLIMNDYSTPPKVVNGVFRPKEGAVTARGKQVLQEMNRLGMIIDLSHTSYWTQKAVLSEDKHGRRISRAPVVFSHSSAYSICPHPRNVRDDILDLVPESNSIVMVNFSPGFISCVAAAGEEVNADEPHFSLPEFYEKNNTLHQVARHITYIGQRIGYDHVGLGSDYDGMGNEHPRGLEGVDKFPDLVAELLRMGVSDEDAEKVVGGNLLRVWKDVEGMSATMRDEGVEPGLDDAGGA
ncbi:hypothetical protein OHC33_009754 [Knufia fluminis]|uniref:Dipeptidase n=1 Tax=Knufia fluminis TaxID=191047 RepID=A0AAN8EPC0_9EURO|nr:hypothetical protein OHC33_009754 [Knufia fluminis]